MKQILVIEDDPDLRQIVSKALRDAGYFVTSAADGAQGLAMFKVSMPDLVLTDLVMPEMEGIEVIVELRRNHPEFRIIAMSSGGEWKQTVYLQLAHHLGATRTLEKPFSIQQLLVAVGEELEK